MNFETGFVTTMWALMVFIFALSIPVVAVWLIVAGFVVAALARWHWCSKLMTQTPPFRTEDHEEWHR